MHASISDFISDICQNSIEADADFIEVEIEESITTVSVTITDNGIGMSEEIQRRLEDPFFTDGTKHIKRRVGLGIPFLIQAVEATEGVFLLESEVGKGTTIEFSFNVDSIDCPPMGSLVTAFVSMLTFSGEYQMVINRTLKRENKSEHYQLDRLELQEVLEGFSSSSNLVLLRQYVQSQEDAIEEIRL